MQGSGRECEKPGDNPRKDVIKNRGMRITVLLYFVPRRQSDIRLICCVSGITAHIASIFRYIDLLYASKLSKSAFALPFGSLRLLMSDRLPQDKLLWTCQLARSTVARAFFHATHGLLYDRWRLMLWPTRLTPINTL